ncbi:Vacuolar protein sorting-associated protein [Trema orientale]|uniref:Vacuolar protein sorting-associated protein n=1 Tax=Trema orientale TaxID=63057 RepID=A0A2P5FS36_TREOI|nr:Vacuolar protein sorting-associated protein [Trema orientale]
MSSILHRSFKPAKCKTALKLAVSRIKLLNNKREAQVKQMKRELAQLLESGQVQTARIRVEHVIREEKTLTAYNFIEVYCELIAARLPIIESQKNCPIDLKEAISSVIFASPRCADIPELADIRKHFTAKYGKEFVSAAIELRPDCGVNRGVVEKLSAKAPDGQTKVRILSAIAEEHNVKWNPDSFGGHDSNPPQDLLNGPNNFEMASKVHTEASSGSAQNQDDKGPPNVQVPRKHDQMHDEFVNLNEQKARPTSGYQNFASADVAPKATTSGIFHPEVRSSGPGTEHMERKQSLSGNENSYSLGRQNWNMQFKDATSAAQAAAESAELASMAARAAAELSRQYSSESQKSYGYVQKGDEPQISPGFKLQSDLVAKQAENNAFHGRNSGLHDKHKVDNEQEELARAAERFHRDGYKNNDRYNNTTSRKSSSASVDDATLVNSVQTVDIYSPRKSSESDKSDLLDEASKKKLSSEFDLTSEEVSYFDKNVSRQQSEGVSSHSHSHSNSFSDDKEDFLRKNDNIAYFDDVKTEKQSSRASSRSHSSTFGDIHDDLLKRNDPSENPFVHDDRTIYRNTSEINSHDNTVVFDDYGSDDDNYKVDDGDFKGQETSFYFPSPSRKPSTDIFADSTEWSPRRNTDERLGKSILQSHPPVFSESLKGSSVPSQQDDLPPAAFDDYESPSSDGEEDLGKSKLLGSADCDKFPSEKNLNLKNSELMIVGSSSSEAGNLGSRRNPWLPKTSVDLQSKEEHPNRSQGIKSTSVSERKLDYAELPPRFMKSGLDSTVKDTPESPDTMEVIEPPKDTTFESSQELSFGTLTGGLRNKGYRHPPYVRKSSENSSSVEQETEDTFSKTEQSSSSPTVRTTIDLGAGNQEPYNEEGSTKLNKRIDPRTFVKHVGSEVELQQETSGSSQLYNQKAGIELNKKSNSRAAHTCFDLDNSDSEEDIPRLTAVTNARRGAGVSRRTKVSSPGTGRIYSRTTVLSGQSTTPKYGAESSSHASEVLPKPLSKTKSSDHLVEQYSPKPIPESRRSSHMESLTSSTRTQAFSSLRTSVEQDTPKPFSESRRSSRVESLKSSTREQVSDYLHTSLEQDTPKPIPVSRRSSRVESIKSSTGEQTSNSLHTSVEQDTPKPIPGSRKSSHVESLKSSTREKTSNSLRASMEQDTPKTIPESRRSPSVESLKASTRVETSISLPKIVTSGASEASKSPVVTPEISSKDKASHVHPKLPDSDAFTAFFQNLRQSRE